MANPISAGIGLAKVMFTDSPYEQIQEEPAVYVARSDGAEKSLIQCMRKNGYSCMPELADAGEWVFSQRKFPGYCPAENRGRLFPMGCDVINDICLQRAACCFECAPLFFAAAQKSHPKWDTRL